MKMARRLDSTLQCHLIEGMNLRGLMPAAPARVWQAAT
jgi:hypothetical protein